MITNETTQATENNMISGYDKWSRLLRNFCSESRRDLSEPFSIGEFTYATNSKIVIRVNRIPEYDGNVGIGRVVDLFKDEVIPDSLFVDLPKVDTEKTTKPCEDCDGEGEITFRSRSGHYYNVDCELCMGDGQIAIRKTLVIGTKIFDEDFIRNINYLPNAKIATEAVSGLKPVPFKFDGGSGIVCVMRDKVDDE